MDKLVIVKLGEGEFAQGFSVNLEVREDRSHRLLAEITGRLPPDNSISSCYSNWQSVYRALQAYRLEKLAAQTTNYSDIEVKAKGKELKTHFNTWLNSEPFRPIREKLLEKLTFDDEVRVIIQTENAILRRLPWHLWNLFDRYSKAEVALSKLACDRIAKAVLPRSKVRILAILGDRTGIDIDTDKQFLESITNAETVFLVEPQRQELNEQLWDERGWDILFFAGHSSSKADATTGCIYINSTESLMMAELKYALKKAIEQGLQLAIFNSCDGLGIGWELAESNIPQIIVMREPVPDLVAQAFLKHFLGAYSRGKSLYTSVREAREKLHGMEKSFPYASWLPVICQNPAEVPPIWQELGCIQSKSKLQKNIMFTIGFIISIVAVVVFLEAKELFYQNKPLNPPLNSNREKLNLWSIYNNPTEGLKIKYPPNWDRQDIKDPLTRNLTRFIPSQAVDSDKENVLISIEYLSTRPLTLDEYTKLAINEIKQYTPNAKIIESHATTLSNRPAFMVVFTGKDGNQIFKTMQVWTLNKNKAYIVTYTAAENKYANGLEIPKKMIESFEIIAL